jgi:hypothetical protein
MLALSADVGDIAVRTDTSQAYRLTGNDPTMLANWTLLPPPALATDSSAGLMAANDKLKEDGWKDAKADGGLACNVTTDDYAALNNLLTAIGSAQTRLTFSGTVRLGTSITIPSNVIVDFMNGGVLAPDSGKTVTINGPIRAPLTNKIFTTGAGTIVLGKNAPQPYIPPEWWGALGDGSTNDNAALQACLAAAAAINGTMLLGAARNYKYSNTLVINQTLTIVGPGPGGSSLPSVLTKTADVAGIQVLAEYVRLTGFTVSGSGVTGSSNGIELGNSTTDATNCILRDLAVLSHPGNGIWLQNGNLVDFDNVTTSANGGIGLKLDSAGMNANANNLKVRGTLNGGDCVYIGTSTANEGYIFAEGNSGWGINCNSPGQNLRGYLESNTSGALNLGSNCFDSRFEMWLAGTGTNTSVANPTFNWVNILSGSPPKLDTSGNLTVNGALGATGVITAPGLALSPAYVEPPLPATYTPPTSAGWITIWPLTANITIANPAATGVDGQLLNFLLQQDGTGGRTITWGSKYAFGAAPVNQATIDTTANAKNIVQFMYVVYFGAWFCVSITKGY